MRDGRLESEKLPKPRISMRWPSASACAIASSIVLTAKSVSRTGSCGKRAAKRAINSDLVTGPQTYELAFAIALFKLGLEQSTQVGGT